MGQIVSGYLDFAERKAERHEPMTMADWSKHLDQILTAGGEQLLKGNGSVSHELAVEKATGEYRKYQQKTLSSVECTFVYMKEILLYKTENEEVKVEILLHNENLWLTQAKMAELFDVQKAAISKHLKNIFESGELDEKVVVSKMETTTPHGAIYA